MSRTSFAATFGAESADLSIDLQETVQCCSAGSTVQPEIAESNLAANQSNSRCAGAVMWLLVYMECRHGIALHTACVMPGVCRSHDVE
jgi:hypothetical protein